MNKTDEKYVEDVGKQLGQMPDTVRAVVALDLIAIIGRLEEERKMQHATIRYYREEVEHLKGQLQNNNLGFYFICAHCSVQTWTKHDSVDSGSLLTCHACKQVTAIDLNDPEVYCEMVKLKAEVSSHKAQLLRLKEKGEPLLKEIETSARILQKKLCGYGSVQGSGLEPSGRCDCKYIQVVKTGSTEETGCCESRQIILLSRRLAEELKEVKDE